MTRDRVRAQQASAPPKPLRMLRVIVITASPLVIELPGGAQIPGIAMAGAIYTAGGTATVYMQEPAIGPVIPHA